MRLLRREWRQRVIIVVLIAVATAAMIDGINVASATPGTPNAGVYGTSSTLVILKGNTPRLAAEIARITKAYGPASVVYDQTLPTGIAGGADLRTQDPNAPYTKVLLALDSGSYPAHAGQVAVTAGLAQLYGLRLGSVWHLPGSGGTPTVTGIVEDPSNLNDEFALLAPGQLASPTQVRIFLGVSATSSAVSNGGDIIPATATVSYPQPGSAGIDPATIVLIVSVLGLVFIGLVASAAFTVMAQRRQRALGMLSSLGATEGDVRFVLIIDGAIAGLLGAVIGTAIGFACWFWYYPHLEIATAHRTDPLNLSWTPLILGVILAIATAVIAAAWPGRAVSKVPTVAAISGRVQPAQRISSSIRRGLIWGGAGLFALLASGGWNGGQSGGVRLRPGRPDRVRDLVRAARAVLRGRALAAGRESAPRDPAGPPRLGAIPVPVGRGPGGFSGQLFVATPALLKTYGISQGAVNPAADILTMRAGLAGVGNLALVSGAFFGLPANAPPCPAGDCIAGPVIATISALPSGAHAPNTVITERAVEALGMRTVPVGWLVQSPAALTAAQINAARQDAVSLGTTIETRSGQLSLGQISEYATVGGMVIALGVLAMTVGLIRGETANDLRTLTAAGASARVRRALTGVTAGALALLGAGLGAVAACLASLAFAHSSVTTTFGNVPWADLALLVIGMPLIAAAVGWLLGGREPSAVARRPLE